MGHIARDPRSSEENLEKLKTGRSLTDQELFKIAMTEKNLDSLAGQSGTGRRVKTAGGKGGKGGKSSLERGPPGPLMSLPGARHSSGASFA